MESTTTKLHETLRKVLALTSSPVEGEAQAAAAMLAKLLTKHNLSIADLEHRGKAAPGVREQGHDLGKAAFKWKLDLADGIAEFYYCVPLVDRTAKTVAFVGRPDNVESLTMLYVWLIDQIKQVAAIERRNHAASTGEHVDPLRWQVSFGAGSARRLIERLREAKERQQQDMTRNEEGDVTALAIHHAAEASDYLEGKYGFRRDGRKTKQQQEHDDAWRREVEAQKAMKARCEATGNMEPYYKAYPWERPDTPEEAAAKVKATKARERNARRRSRSTGMGRYRYRATDDVKDNQSCAARTAGRAAADRVNIQPFVSGGTLRKEVG